MTSTRSYAAISLAAIALLIGAEGLATAQALPTPHAPTPLSIKRGVAGTHTRPMLRSVQLPMAFEAKGSKKQRQDDFIAQGPGYRLALSPREATFQLPTSPVSSQGATGQKKPLCETLTMQLVGADPSAHAVQTSTPTGHANYFMGNDHSKWRTDIPLYDRVEYRQVYRGIDLAYYGNQSQLEYDFLVRPGIDPKRIGLKFAGARTVRIAANGELVLSLKQGEVRWHRPLTYQTIAGRKRMVASSFVLKNGGEVGFRLARYDTTRPLTIDPKIVYSKPLIGTYVSSLAVDSEGNTYLTGYIPYHFVDGKFVPNDFPVTPGAFQTANQSAFVAKLNPSGTAFLYATYLGGSRVGGYLTDFISSIAIDAQGNAFVTGTTQSTDFPITPGAFQKVNLASTEVVDLGHPGTSFVTKLNPTGSALVYSTYLGGHSPAGSADVAIQIAVDSQGSAYITGFATSLDFPTTPGTFQPTSRSTGYDGNGFVTKLNPSGTALVYSTYLGGSQGAECSGIALGSAGEAYVTGRTSSADFPVTPGAFQTTNRQRPLPASPAYTTAFITRLNSTGAALIYSTYLGGTGPYGDRSAAIAVDKAGNAYVTGSTSSPDFPTTPGVFQPTGPAIGDTNSTAYVTKLNPAGSALIYSTFLGRSGGRAIAVDSAGNACVIGLTNLPGFPTTPGAFRRTFPAVETAVTLARLNATGTARLYSTYLPEGLSAYAGYALAIDNRGIVTLGGPGFVTRFSAQPIFPDFNNDGNTDLLLKNQATGVIGVWFMNGADVVGGVPFSQTPPASYTLVGAGDFRADGTTTLAFQDGVDNRVIYWYTGGTNSSVITGGDYVHPTPEPGWKLVGVADFNQDGYSDLLFQNQTTGRITIWNMLGPQYQGGMTLPQMPGTDWKVVGTGDFNGDGFADIIFQNQTTGALRIWFMQGTVVASQEQLTATAAPGWTVVGTGDYNGDGKADLLLQNPTTNQTAIWYLNGALYQGGSGLSQSPPLDWKIVGPR